jgi:predicted transcriptional regulator
MSSVSQNSQIEGKTTNEHKKSEHIKKELQNDSSKHSTQKSKSVEPTSQLKNHNIIQGMPDHKISTYVSNKKIDDDFEPSMKMIIRIINSIVHKGTKTKTDLSIDTSLNYTRLVKHVIWMEKKGLVKSIVENSKIKVDLTNKGKLFGMTISEIIE